MVTSGFTRVEIPSDTITGSAGLSGATANKLKVSNVSNAGNRGGTAIIAVLGFVYVGTSPGKTFVTVSTPGDTIAGALTATGSSTLSVWFKPHAVQLR